MLAQALETEIEQRWRSMKSENTDLTGDQMVQAVFCVEGLHHNKARNLLSQILKTNDNNGKAWLWRSRVTKDVGKIQTFLTNAYHLAPSDLLIRQEVKRFRIARKDLDGSAVKRCPFCWVPLNIDKVFCVYCNSALTIDPDDRRKKRGRPMRTVLRKAQQRYQRVAKAEQNAKAEYYLGLAYFNLGEQGLSDKHLERAVALQPDIAFLEGQRKALHKLADPQPSHLPPAQKKDVCAAATSPSKNTALGQVLVIEDSITVRKLVTRTLNRTGKYHVVEAASGREALTLLESTSPDLILLDIILPGMNGYEVLEKIRSNPQLQTTPVVILSLKDLDKEQNRHSMANGYLPKPFTADDLSKTVNKFINTLQLRHQ